MSKERKVRSYWVRRLVAAAHELCGNLALFWKWVPKLVPNRNRSRSYRGLFLSNEGKAGTDCSTIVSLYLKVMLNKNWLIQLNANFSSYITRSNASRYETCSYLYLSGSCKRDLQLLHLLKNTRFFLDSINPDYLKKSKPKLTLPFIRLHRYMMGGHAFKNLYCPRINPNVYCKVKAQATIALHTVFAHVVVPTEMPKKVRLRSREYCFPY